MDLQIEYVDKTALKPYAKNAKIHTPEQVEQIKESIARFGFNDPVAVWHDNEVVEGHGRLLAAMDMPEVQVVPIIRLDSLTDEERRAYMLVHNKLTMNTDFDYDMLGGELDDIVNIDMSQFGFDTADVLQGAEAADGTGADAPAGKLTDRFIVPPFSVLDGRQGYWLDRKREWRDMIGDKGQARASVDVVTFHEDYGAPMANASLLDPVLCEVMLKWFAPDNGTTFDVFAGDTMFGYVSATLGHAFTGIELREEQCEFNRAACGDLPVNYICDDGRNVLQHIEAESRDMLFSCPPYFDLEIYSDKENDASNQKTYTAFYDILDKAFTDAIKCLKNNRFAVIVCGDVRNKKTGGYYGFPDDIKKTFLREGCILYNELILVDPIGTACVRAARYMDVRKVAKVHQNILIFYKGNVADIKKEFPKIEVAENYESNNI